MPHPDTYLYYRYRLQVIEKIFKWSANSTTQKIRFIKCSNNCTNVEDSQRQKTGEKIVIKEHNGNVVWKGRKRKMSLERNREEDALLCYI